MALLRTSSSTRTVTTLLALIAVTVGAVMLLAPTAEAEPAHGTHIKYYSDATLCTQVGFRYYTCEGVLDTEWGVTSPYYTSATYGCVIDP